MKKGKMRQKEEESAHEGEKKMHEVMFEGVDVGNEPR